MAEKVADSKGKSMQLSFRKAEENRGIISSFRQRIVNDPNILSSFGAKKHCNVSQEHLSHCERIDYYLRRWKEQNKTEINQLV